MSGADADAGAATTAGRTDPDEGVAVEPAEAPVDLSIVTLNAGRDDHLRRLVDGLARCRPGPCELVVVTMGPSAPPVDDVAARAGGLAVRWVEVDLGPDGALPLAAARNAGIAAAEGSGIVLLDVDCIPGPDLVGAYAAALAAGPGMVAGPVRWLERFWDHDLDGATPDERWLRARSRPHPARPVPAAVVVDDRHELLWSLALGARPEDLARVGGFDEGYVGYGAEDTDLGFRARAAGVPVRWIPTGTAYHQWHPVSDPPVEHVDAIVGNATRFRERWGRWPMEGWLAAFAEAGLVEWSPEGDRLRRTGTASDVGPRRVVSIPATHPYTRRVLPEPVRCDPDPTRPWWPHPALEPAWVRDGVGRGDVVHLHFGFEHRSVEEVQRWAEAVHAAGAGLVVTVHDIDNPHCAGSAQAEHHRRTAAVLAEADAVLTLTDDAADEIARRWGRRATVVPHPHVAALDRTVRPLPPGPPVVGVDLKALRAGSLDPTLVLAGLGAAAEDAGGCAVAWLEDGVDPCRAAEVADAARRAGVELRTEAAPDDTGLADRFADLDVAVLPYATGTHSGLLELCRDVGTRPVVPERGCYRAQWHEAVAFSVGATDADVVCGLRRAAGAALAAGPPAADPPGWRRDQLDAIRARHLEVYRRVAAGERW